MSDHIRYVAHAHNDQGWMRQLFPSELQTWWARVPLRSNDGHKDAVLKTIIKERTDEQ